MSMDVIKQVTDSEAQAKERLALAQAEARALVEQAQREGEAALESARKDAQEQVKAMLAQAREAGEEKTRQTLAEYETDCGALKERAQVRLDKAAERIVGKVVRG